MKLKQLKKEIPYQWRVQSFSKFKATATCVAYIDARDVMNILDEVVGEENWEDDYKLIDGKLLAGIGIRTENGVVWKWDTGTESETEAEKGQMSDAFKRAGVKWGIGRFLYNLEIKTVTTDGAKTDAHKYPKVIDAQGKVVYDLSEHINSMKSKTPKTEPNKPTIYEQVNQAINQSTTLPALESIVIKIKGSEKLTNDEKDLLLAEATFKSEELSSK